MGMFDFFSKRAPDRKESDQPGSPQFFRAGKYHVISYQEALAAEAALRHPVIFRCVNKIAESVQSVRWYCDVDPLASNDEKVPARDIKAINEVLRYPNDTYTSDQMRYWLTMNYCIYGRVPFKVGVGTEKRPNGLYPLTTANFHGVANNRGLLDHYEYGEAKDTKEVLPIRRKANGAPFAYEIARPNLQGSIVPKLNSNITPIGALGLPSQVITLLLQRAIDTAAGHPNAKYIVSTEKTLTEPQKNELLDMLERRETGGEEAGNVLIFYNTLVKVEKLDNDLSDIHSKVPSDDMARMIAGAFGIPVALIGLGAADSAKFASNYTESRRSFWADTIIPAYLSPIATGLTTALCPPGCQVRFDFDTIDALRDHNIGNAKKIELTTFLTKDEKRELTGFDPLTPEQKKELEEMPLMPGQNPSGEMPNNDPEQT